MCQENYHNSMKLNPVKMLIKWRISHSVIIFLWCDFNYNKYKSHLIQSRISMNIYVIELKVHKMNKFEYNFDTVCI